MQKEVLAIMTNDSVTAVSQNDSLILSLGESWLRRNMVNSEKRKYYASARIWVSARLLQLNSSAVDTEQINPLCDFLKPHFNYDIVLATLKCVFPNFFYSHNRYRKCI